MGGAGRGIRGPVVRVLRADVPARSSARTCRGAPAGRSAWPSSAPGSIVPASGAGGLALGAWILSEGGMPAERIASRSVAFFLIKSSVNFVAVAVLGTVMALGLVGPDLSLWLTAVPAVGALLVIAAVLVVPRLGVGAPVAGRRGADAQGNAGGAQGPGGRHGRGGADRAVAKSARDHRRDRLLGLGQRRPVGDLPRLRLLAADHGDPDGLPDRAARRAAAATGRPRRDRRRADRHADRVRHPGGRRPPRRCSSTA